MADVDLRQRRLQMLMERRKAQTNTENKKQELEDEKLKLHHLKTKSMREQWLLGGQLKRTPSQTDMAEERVKEDEALTEQLYENVRRLEEEVSRMECAERELLLREKAVLQQLHPEEPPADGVQQDVETMLPDDDGGVQYIITEIPDFPAGFTLRDGPGEHGERAAVYAMAISVEKDSKTGETRVVSSTPMSPKDAQSRGVKVYDDGCKVVYAIGHDGQPLTNGVEAMSSEEVDALVSRAGPADLAAAPPSSSPEPKATTNDAADNADAPAPSAEPPGPAASAASPRAKSPPLAREAVMGIETKDGLARVYPQPNAVHGDAAAAADGRAPKPAGDDEGAGGTSMAGGDIDPERPVTMVFMGYEQVEDEEDTRKALGYEGAGTAELVVIGGDDDADDAADDATAATPLTADPTTGPAEPPPRATKKPCACRCCTIM